MVVLYTEADSEPRSFHRYTASDVMIYVKGVPESNPRSSLPPAASESVYPRLTGREGSPVREPAPTEATLSYPF